jgi:hypothetical protein
LRSHALALGAALLTGGCLPVTGDGPTLLCPSSFDGESVVVPVGETLVLEPDRALRFPADWTWELDFAPPESAAELPLSYLIRAPFTPDVPGVYQLSIVDDGEREASCSLRAVDRLQATLDLEAGTRSLDEVQLAGGSLQLALRVNEPVSVTDLEVRAGTPGVLLAEPRVFRDGDVVVVDVPLAADARDDELFGLQVRLRGLVTGTDVDVDEAVRLRAPEPTGPRLHEARCAWDERGRAVVLVHPGEDEPVAVDVGGFTLGSHALALDAVVDGELRFAFDDAVARVSHAGVVRARTEGASGPPLAFTCALD